MNDESHCVDPPGTGALSPRSAKLFIRAYFAVALSALAIAVLAQEPAREGSLNSLKHMSLEELMDIEVTSVSKRPEKLQDAASAIQVITGEDIRRSGASSLPEALRLADNLDVAQQNSHDWAISARGFNANLANKLLVLIDGRAVYTPLYGGVLWNVQDYMLEDIDRIEVISGPGGTLWGANAVNGVINIISKSAKNTQGGYLEAGSGSGLKGFSSVRYGGTLASGIYYRIYAKYFDRDSEVFSDGSAATNSWRMSRGGFRIDSEAFPQNTLTLQGDIYNGTENLGAVDDGKLSGGNILGRWSHIFPDDSDMSLQLYYDRAHLTQPFAASPAVPPYVSGFPAAALKDDLDTYDLDFQHRFSLGEHHKFVWGLGYRLTHEVDEDLSVVRFSPPELDRNLFSAFAQDEITLRENWMLTLGTKLEHNDYTGFEVEPSVRLQWELAPRQMLWTAASRAVRTPARYDRDLHVVSGLINAPAPYQFPTDFLKGGDDFVAETLMAFELGYRAQLGSNISASIAAFYNDYNDLRSTTSTPTTALYIFPYPVFFQNNLEGETYGIELSATYQVRKNWRLRAGYNLLKEHIRVKPGQVDGTGALNETADPEQQISLHSVVGLPRQVELEAALRWVDTRPINKSPTDGPILGTVPSYFELDLHLGWHPTEQLELSIAGQNLLHNHHPEYGFPSPAREEIQRSVYGKVTWRY